MHIIWLTTQFPSSSTDTKGSFINRTVRELSKHYQITTICLHSIVPPILPILKDIKNAKKIYKVWRSKYPKKPVAPLDLAGNVIYAKYIRLPRGWFQYLEGWFGYIAVKKYLDKIIVKDSIIHATWLFPEGDLANYIYKKYKVPFIVTLMGSDVHFLQKSSKKWTKAKEIINNTSFVTSVSKQLYLDLENKAIFVPNEKRQLTHTIYDFDKFKILNKKEIRTELNLSELDKIIFYAGTLRDIKNVDVFIMAFSNLLSNSEELRKNTKLIIAGKGEEEGKLKSLVEKFNIKDKVNFVGGLNGDEIVKYYNAADVFCLPSQNEGLPNVVVEALLCETPVVASSVGEIPYIIEEGKNGYLVSPNNVEELMNKLILALNNNWIRENLRESVNFLNPESVLSEYKLLYSKMEKSL